MFRRTSFSDSLVSGNDGKTNNQFKLRTTATLARPVVIGLCGGVASGKSTIAALFAKMGAVVLDADVIGHEVLECVEVKQRIRETWGQKPFEGSNVSRRALAAIVFNPFDGPRQLAVLEEITHPLIKQKIVKRLSDCTAANSVAVVVDAPLLLEAGWDELCDKLVFVECEQAVRLQRARQRGWTEQEFLKREQRQLPVDEKRNRSEAIIENSNNLDESRKQVTKLWNQWQLNSPNPA